MRLQSSLDLLSSLANGASTPSSNRPTASGRQFHGTWFGHYILDGYAIADEYRMIGSSGELIVLGMNFRVYDSARQVWNIKWLNALDGTWTDLTPELFGGARFDGQSVTYVFKSELAPSGPLLAPPIQIFPSRISPGAAKSPTTRKPGLNSWSWSAIVSTE